MIRNILNNERFNKNFFTNYRNIVVFVITCLIFFLIFEIILRISHYNILRDYLNGREFILQPSENKEMLYKLRPNAEGYAWGTQVKINSHGFRDKEYEIAKGDATYRIITIGDSITFGNFMPLEKTYSKQLESLFERDRENTRNVEVLNLGVGGYDTLNEVAFFEEVGIKFQPDVVVLGFCINDAGTDSPNLDYIVGLQRYRSFIYRFRTAQFIRSRMERILYMNSVKKRNDEEFFFQQNKDMIVQIGDDEQLEATMQALKDYLAKNTVPDYYINYYEWYTSKVRIGKLRYAFEKLQRMRDQYHFNVVILIIPFLIDPQHQTVYQFIYDITKHEALRANFNVLEVYDEFQDMGFDQLAIQAGDRIHPNSLGHSVIADKLYRYVTNSIDSKD